MDRGCREEQEGKGGGERERGKKNRKSKKGKKEKENRNETKREAELSYSEWEEGYKERRYVCMYQTQDVAGRAAQTQNQNQKIKDASEMKLGCESP